MEIMVYFNILLKRLWIIILFPLVALGVSMYISHVNYIPMYESSTTMLVINKTVDPKIPMEYTDLLVGQQLVKEYKEIIKSRTVTKAVIEELNIKNMNYAQLAKKISVGLKNETRILEIKITDETPEGAQKLADKVSEVFIRKISEITNIQNIVIVDPAEKPSSPIQLNYKKTFLICIMGGLLVAFLIIFLLEDIDDTLKTISDIEKKLGYKVLGTIPDLKMKHK